MVTYIDKAGGNVAAENTDIVFKHEYFQSLFEHNTDFIFSTDVDGNFTNVNATFVEIFGYTKEELLGKPVLQYIDNDVRDVVRNYFKKSLTGKEQSYQLEHPTKTGERHYFQIRHVPIIINEKVAGIFCIGRDITERKVVEEKIFQIAFYDMDTGLPNRLKIRDLLKEKIREAKKNKSRVAIVFIDINRFKMINDSLGHFTGDQILKQISRRIMDIVPKDAILGRFGGDKFTLILTENIDTHSIMELSEKILRSVSKPITFEGQEFFLSASIGVSYYPEDGGNEELLLKNADTANNRAKKQGGTKITFFSYEMNDQIKYRFELENYLRRAIEKNELYLVYQPLVDLRTGALIGSEALLRWKHPKLGLIPPMHFIPIAEETGIIHDIGRWVLQEACKQNQKWIEEGYHDLFVSVNVSAQQIQNRDFLNIIKEALTLSGMEPKHLLLELTESGMLGNIKHSIEMMKSIKELGVQVSIDDFGTGYSSLSYLKSLPINSLKIDQTFINNLDRCSVDKSIVKAIITIGSGMSVKVVAEGVETYEQLKELKELNCDYAQGYFIEKPVDKDTFERLLKTRKILKD